MRDYELNPRGHIWKRDEDNENEVDIFGVEYMEHKGPICVKCGYFFCHHCQSEPDIDCPVTDAEWKLKSGGAIGDESSK